MPVIKQSSPTAQLLKTAINHEKQRDKQGPPHVIVNAGAGTGKTTTIIEGLKRIRGVQTSITPSIEQEAIWNAMSLTREPKFVCVLAFNSSIAGELRTRVPARVDAKTFHGMGFYWVKKALGPQEPCEYATEELIARLVDMDLKEMRRKERTLLDSTKRLVSLCKTTLSVPTSQVLSALADHYQIDLEDDEVEAVYQLVPTVLEAAKKPQGKISFDDQIWLPVVLNLPMLRFDLMLVDERQDLNRCQMELALKAGKRIVAVGDKNQSIYGFSGADTAACETFKELLLETGRGVVELPLLETRRCGKVIVTLANEIVPELTAHPDNPDGLAHCLSMGESSPDNYRVEALDGDMVICRVNAPLVSECFKLLKMGKKAAIQGREDVAQGLINMVERLMKDQSQQTTGALRKALAAWLTAEVDKENKRTNPRESRLIALQDRHDCVSAFADGVETVSEVIGRIQAIFTDDKQAKGIKLSSIHRAKGLEADRVFFLEPKGAECPHPAAKSEWQIDQEWNLRYVGITRAKKELVFVS